MNHLRYSMDEPGGWYEYPAALVDEGQVLGWVCDEPEARLIVDLYRFRGDLLAKASQLLACLSSHGGVAGGSFDVETSAPLLLPGFPIALKWDGKVMAWLHDESLGRTLASVLNAFTNACRAESPRISTRLAS